MSLSRPGLERERLVLSEMHYRGRDGSLSLALTPPETERVRDVSRVKAIKKNSHLKIRIEQERDRGVSELDQSHDDTGSSSVGDATVTTAPRQSLRKAADRSFRLNISSWSHWRKENNEWSTLVTGEQIIPLWQ